MSSEEIVIELGKWPTGNIADALRAMGYMVVMHQDIRPIFVPVQMVGRARTVKYERSNRPGDGLSPIKFKEDARPGDIYVLAISGYRHGDRVIWGENSATSIKVRGARGAVIDGGCRDTAAIRRMKFPVFCRAISPGGWTNTFFPVAFDVPVVCGGIRVHPGDIVVGDDDGICVIPREIEEEALVHVRAYGERDQAVAPALRSGKSVSEAYKIKRDWMEKAGLK
jgi:4-hydroxy-4-methyl-2-oxoglutarate aldolase